MYESGKSVSLNEALDNMRGGCAHDPDGREREPGNYTDKQAMEAYENRRLERELLTEAIQYAENMVATLPGEMYFHKQTIKRIIIDTYIYAAGSQSTKKKIDDCDKRDIDHMDALAWFKL